MGDLQSPSLPTLLVVLLFVFPSIIHSSRSSLIQITDSNWHQITHGNDEWMIEFFAPWCPACRNLNPIWEDFSTWSSDLGIKIGQVDITTSPGLSGRFMITALPTIYHYKDGLYRQYRGPRTKDEFMLFIEDKRWKDVDPISWWYSPNSILMTVVSGFYQLSMEMRNLLNVLTENYGIPVWMTYALCGITTILVGLILGLCLVFCIDFFYPQKPFQQVDFKTMGLIDDLEELDDEDLEDDTETAQNNTKQSPKERDRTKKTK